MCAGAEILASTGHARAWTSMSANECRFLVHVQCFMLSFVELSSVEKYIAVQCELPNFRTVFQLRLLETLT